MVLNRSVRPRHRPRGIERDVVELRAGGLDCEEPGLAAVMRAIEAAVIRVVEFVRVLRVDPQAVVITVNAACGAAIEGAGGGSGRVREGLSAIHRAIETQTH